MKIKKSNLEVLFNLTKGTDSVLGFAEARVRDNFIKPLAELVKTYYADRETIYKAFCLTKEDGTPDLLDGDKYQFPKEKTEGLNQELQTIADEEVEVNTSDNSQQIKGILEKSEYKPKVGESEVIDELLKLL